MIAALRVRPRAIDALWLTGLACAVLLVYGSSLAYPFFWVDPIDIGLAGSRSIPTILVNSQGYLYYRPFAFIEWKALQALANGFHPFAFHAIQVLTHLLNAWLFYALARRILPNGAWRLAPGLAALCLAWYPASFQAVTWVVSPQVQATAFMLAAAIAYYDGRVKNDARRIGLSLVLLALGLPFHENAASFGFVIAALEAYLVFTQRIQPGRFSRWPIAHIALCAAFAVVWLAIPKDPDSTVARLEVAVGWYLLQGLIWPVAGAVGPWREWLGLNQPAWQPLIITAPITLAFLLAAYWRARRMALFGFGLTWFLVMALPIWATRGIDYVGVSPRVLYVAAPGAILMWVGLLTLAFPSPAASRLWKIATRVLVALVLIQSLAFLAVRKEVHDQALPAVWDVVRSGQQAGAAAHLLYINVPDQITPRLREYPVGFFRAILMPVSVDLEQYVELHTGAHPSTRSLSVPALAGLDKYPYQVDLRGVAADQAALAEALRAADTAFIAEYRPDGAVRVVEAGSLVDCSACPAPDARATFGDRAALIEARAEPHGDQVKVTSTWECRDAFDAQDTIFLHALDETGRLATQADGDPLRDLLPLSECRPGERIRDVRYLVLPPGSYTIRTGIYNRETGERLAAFDAAGQRAPDDAVTIGRVTG